MKARLEEGQEIGGFRLGASIHKGGMAELWEVTKPGLDMPAILKVPRIREGEDPAAIVSFEMEQMIMPRLKGPYVPAFIAKGDFPAEPYIIMERIPAPSLLKRLDDLPLPVDEVADLGARIADALAALHRQHVVHLDVKPSNIMFRPDGTAVILDYGLSRHLQLPDLMEEEFRLPYGTAPYMAPEQVMGVRSDPRSDLFALGVLMYFFATGVRPFGDPQRLSGLKKRIWRDPYPPRKYRSDLPNWFQEIVLRCLEVRPARRHPSATQLAFDLRYPDEVAITTRATRYARDPLAAVLRRRFNPDETIDFRAGEAVTADAAAPIIAVAVDLADQSAATAEVLQATLRRLLDATPGARVACLNVLRQSLMTIERSLDEEGRNRHVQRLVELKHWARPLKLPEGRITFHVLEAADPAAAILDYARASGADHLVLGARANSTMRSLLGSVAGEVAAKAPCTVTVVRRAGAE